MVKPSAKTSVEVRVEFPRTGNPWLDAGTVGLYRVLNEKPPYVDPPADPEALVAPATRFPEVDAAELAPDRYVVQGPADQVQACLEAGYDRLVATYFNVSSKKQLEEKGSYNFYYDPGKEDKDRFILFPKKKAAGAALLLFDKAARPSRDQEEWGTAPDSNGKAVRTPGRMPPKYAHLQDRLDTFLKESGVKPGPPAGLLIGGPNQVRPKVEIRVSERNARLAAPCFLTGDGVGALVEAKETAFPLLGGSRSFVNGVADWPRMGWKADLAGKFVPAVSFFYIQGDLLHVFFPESTNLQRIDALAEMLVRMKSMEPNLFRNFELLLGVPKLRPTFRRRSEVALGFLYSVFVKLSEHQPPPIDEADLAPRPVGTRLVSLDNDLDSEESPEEEAADPDPEPPISVVAVEEALWREGTTSFCVVSAAKKGNVWMARDFTTFRDVDRLARLFARMQRRITTRDGRAWSECKPQSFFAALLDFTANPETRSLTREKVSEAILRGESVLSLLERHAFHVNTHSDPGKWQRVGPLLDFARLYEVDLRRGTKMEEEYKEMVRTATWLGESIGKALAIAVQGGGDPPEGAKGRDKESPGRARGGLFRLRKARTIGAFVNELDGLVFRYKIDVPKDVFDGVTLAPRLFEEFRGFCVLAALNKFQYLTGKRSPSQPTTPNP